MNFSLADGNGTNGTNSTNSKRRLEMEFLTSMTNSIVPLVFYGTAFSMLVKIILNVISAAIYIVIIRRDSGY